jgi:hypothetical protein
MAERSLALVLLAACALAADSSQQGVPWGGTRRFPITGGGGTVTSVRPGFLMSFTRNPLVDTGTIGFDSLAFMAWYVGDPTAFHHGDTTDRNDRLYASKVETDSVISKPTSTKMVFGRGDTGVTPGTPIALDTSLVFALVAKFTGKVIANSLHGVGANVTGVNAVATGGLDTSAIFLRSMPRAGKGGFLVSTAGITTNDSQPWARIYERATKDTLVATAWQGLDSATTDAAIGGCSVSADTIITGVAGRYSIRWGLCLDTLVTVGANIGMVVKLFVAGNPYVQYGNRITPLAIGSTYWCALTGGMDIDIAASQRVYLSIYPAAGCALLGGTAATSQCYLSVRLSEN